ncbi:hypothetical protein GTP56_05355 [Duganella sp. FT134W]|uniref:Ubiquinol-cytochrome c chaperone domain-containing protein n=1 Tax=Duganella margarita TaxID=2692170 RepID=A0A7X4GXN8_9BURK|nr:ubiquinol-cytochrome C chaperone family protein [Duganella margarita]MYM71623.1 hypothetical protein [Duganella margarita]
MTEEFIKNPSSLSLLLAQADVEDLDILVDYITDNGEGRISLNNDVCARLVQCKERKNYTSGDRTLIENEIRSFGGNTLTNVYREVRSNVSFGSLLDKVLPAVDTSISYDEIVKDVASHLKVPYGKSDDVLIVEDGILRKILRDSLEKMSPEERATVLKELNVTDLGLLGPAASAALIAAGRAGGFATYKLALVVANAVSKAILGRGLPLVVNAAAARTIGIVLGPIGWVVTGVWTLADMASPAYRVTVPCVVQISYMRQKAIVEASSKGCSACGARNERSARFCNDCGADIKGE